MSPTALPDYVPQGNPRRPAYEAALTAVVASLMPSVRRIAERRRRIADAVEAVHGTAPDAAPGNPDAPEASGNPHRQIIRSITGDSVDTNPTP